MKNSVLCVYVLCFLAVGSNVLGQDIKPISEYGKRPSIIATEAKKSPADNPCLHDSAALDKIEAIAVFPYRDEFRNLHCSNSKIEWNIKKSGKIELITKAFSRPTMDGSRLGILPDAHIYFEDSEGHKSAGMILLNWRYVMMDRDISRLYPLDLKISRIIQEKVEAHP